MDLPKIENETVAAAREAALTKLEQEIKILERSGQPPREEFLKHARVKVSAPFVQINLEGNQPHKVDIIYANALENVKLMLGSQTSDEELGASNLQKLTAGPSIYQKEAQILIAAMNEGFRKLGAKTVVAAINLAG